MRRFVGPTFTDPSGQVIFNIQSVVNCWAMHAVRGFGDHWQDIVRETVAPEVWDVGANIGQFGRLIRMLNPGANIRGFEPWPGMERYHPEDRWLSSFACGKNDNEARKLQRSQRGWTASTQSGVYGGETINVVSVKLDTIWRQWGGIPPTLLKIDVDGAEWDVLAGASEIVKATRILIIETTEPRHLPSGFDWSTVNGFDWIGIRP